MLTELARLSVAHAHPRANRACALGIGGVRAAAAPARLPALRPDIPVAHACALSRLRFFVTTLLSSGVRRPRGFTVSGRVLVPRGGCRRRAAVFGHPGALPVLQVHVGVFAVVGAVSAPVCRRWLACRTEVRVDPLLELGGYLRVVAQAGGPFDGVFIRGDLHELANVGHPNEVPGGHLARSDRLPRPLLCAGPPRRSPRPRRPSFGYGSPPLARGVW